MSFDDLDSLTKYLRKANKSDVGQIFITFGDYNRCHVFRDFEVVTVTNDLGVETMFPTHGDQIGEFEMVDDKYILLWCSLK